MNLIKSSKRNRAFPAGFGSERFWNNDLFDMWETDRLVQTVPSINIREEDKSFEIEMAAPGLKKEDFNIDVDNNLVTISSEKETENKDDGGKKGYSFREYNYSSFSRSFTIPDNADADKIEACYKDGVLCMSIPKKNEAPGTKSQKIKVK
jgi:HSP20 family protein